MHEQDPFETLGVDARFDLDLDALAARHRALSGALHPDRHAGRPASERRLALDRAIAVNAAWRALRDPVTRAEALLRRAGVAQGELTEPKPSPALLLEMLEAREELADARAAADLERVGRLAQRMRLREGAVIGELAHGLASGAFGEALVKLGELRYLRRFFEEVAAIEEHLVA